MRAADAVAELAKFSAFGQVDLGKLEGNHVLTQRGAPMGFPRDAAVEAVYLVNAPLAKTVELHRQWSPIGHSELNVLLHGDLATSRPAPGDFAKLATAPGSGPVRAFAAATMKLPEKGQLQMSNAEAADFSKYNTGGGKQGSLPAPVYAFWTHLLSERASAFGSKGLGGEPAYDFGGGSARAAQEMSRLLKEQPKVRAEFASFLGQTPLGGGSSLPSSPYWEMFDVEGQAAVLLGAAYSRVGADSAQMVDMQYYASNGYLAYISLYQMWPVTVNGHEATLVWRGDSLSSLDVAEQTGAERMGAVTAIMKETGRMVQLFLRDVSR